MMLARTAYKGQIRASRLLLSSRYQFAAVRLHCTKFEYQRRRGTSIEPSTTQRKYVGADAFAIIHASSKTLTTSSGNGPFSRSAKLP